MPARLLIYHMDIGRRRRLEDICRSLDIEPVYIDETSYGTPVGLLTGTADIRKLALTAEGLSAGTKRSGTVDEDMIVMSGFESKQFDGLLDALKENSLRVELKAVETATNRYWSGRMLQDELKKERHYSSR